MLVFVCSGQEMAVINANGDNSGLINEIDVKIDIV